MGNKKVEIFIHSGKPKIEHRREKPGDEIFGFLIKRIPRGSASGSKIKKKALILTCE
jgi:hypothetical protein